MEAWLEIGPFLQWMHEMRLRGNQPDISSGVKCVMNASLGVSLASSPTEGPFPPTGT